MSESTQDFVGQVKLFIYFIPSFGWIFREFVKEWVQLIDGEIHTSDVPRFSASDRIEGCKLRINSVREIYATPFLLFDAAPYGENYLTWCHMVVHKFTVQQGIRIGQSRVIFTVTLTYPSYFDVYPKIFPWLLLGTRGIRHFSLCLHHKIVCRK